MVFFFSSRRRHTRFDCDWSSDVCSSDLANFNTRRQLTVFYALPRGNASRPRFRAASSKKTVVGTGVPEGACLWHFALRSEERRVGKSVDLGGRRIIKKKKRKNSNVRYQ